MWLWPITHGIIYGALCELGYDSHRADEAAGLIALLCVLTGAWLGIELFIYSESHAHGN